MTEKSTRIQSKILKKFVNKVNPKYSRFSNLEHALMQVTVEGMFFEFGVSSGFTINFISGTDKMNGKVIYGFDSWEGIPEDWHVKNSITDPTKSAFFPRGSWKVSEKPTVNSNVILIDGLFENSLPQFIKQNTMSGVAFIHVDSDLYSSAKTILHNLGPYIVKGTVIVFDEWHAVDHEEKAFKEWLEESNKTASIVYTTDTGQITAIID